MRRRNIIPLSTAIPLAILTLLAIVPSTVAAVVLAEQHPAWAVLIIVGTPIPVFLVALWLMTRG